ncbi:Tumor necrosis factor receptor superfamily member 11B [Mesitornis unicolor]|uniref:Tumor necrosis factor receptor superfamily member 11B n=1 Tax=Mesitornis unicolor TaxID=54374 RepID=A0A091R1T1_9AVES|nr:PREDICTED: tumor necrosis factor receptor superfamily member 11B [Mesitornis unicolor]KFQ33745.1 Tumor necrosis factor receptor superfamily member 11B [Mesitornis unicolor]
MNKFLCCTLVLLDISVKWTIQDESPRKYPHYDPGTSRQLLCDQCPPGTYVKQHCTATSATQCAPCPDQYYAEEWNSDDECQYCSAVCKELQFVKQECSSTQPRLCECVEGRHLELEFCLKHTECPPGFGVAQPGTPESDTVCKRCPEGFFSNETSSKAACVKHTNCSVLGFKIALKGNAVRDNICQENTDAASQKCGIDVTLCEEAFFRFAVPTFLVPNWLNVLADSLPGTKLSMENIERMKERHTPQEQTFQLFKVWKQQNKEQDMVKKIIQDINQCENSILKHIGHLNLTFEHLNTLMASLPGKQVGKEDIEDTMKRCQPAEQVLKLLNLWRIKNGDQDTTKGLMYGLKHLKTYHFPKRTIQSLRKVVKFLHRFMMYRLHQKLLLEMVGNQRKSVKVRCV